MTRCYCENCRYPKKVCICSYLVKVNHKTKIIVLACPKEYKHAKNTLRLAELVFTNIDILFFDEMNHEQVQIDLFKSCNPILLFPKVNSSYKLDVNHITLQKLNDYDTVIVIDATWRKALKFYLTNTWLHSLSHLELPRESSMFDFSFNSYFHDVKQSQSETMVKPEIKVYKRKAKLDKSFSTLEVIVSVLTFKESLDCSGVANVLAQRMKLF